MARKKDVTLYAENPFMGQIADLKTRKRRVTVQSGKAILDTKTGEIEDVAEIVSVQHVDNAQFLKLYTGNLRQFFNLKPSTFKLVEVLLSQYSRPDRHHVDQVYLNISVAERYFSEQDIPKISKAAFHSAMKELIVKGFIAESTDPNMYWINPALFFNGDRVRFVKEYRNRQYKQQSLPFGEDEQAQLSNDEPEAAEGNAA